MLNNSTGDTSMFDEESNDSEDEEESSDDDEEPSSKFENAVVEKGQERLNSWTIDNAGVEQASSKKVDKDGTSVMRIVFSSSCNPEEDEASGVPFTYNMPTGESRLMDKAGGGQEDPSRVSKRKRGRPKKSLSCLPTKDVKESPKRRLKVSSSLKLKVSTVTKNKGSPPSTKLKTTSTAKLKTSPSLRNKPSSKPKVLPSKAKSQNDPHAVEIDAVTLATEMGFENPHEKLTIKTSGDKEEDITKQISPIEIIQQAIDYKKTCKCTCLADLTIRDIAAHRMEITLLDRQSRDFVILGLLRCAAVPTKDTTRRNGRIRNRFVYRLLNTRICHVCFLSLNNVGGKYLKNMKKHYAQHGVTSRIHGNLGRKPYHAISTSDISGVVDFVTRYASLHGTPAARPPKNPKSKRIIRLPPSDNVTSVHKKYKEYYDQTGKRAIALTSFRKVWSRHISHVKLSLKDAAAPSKSYGTSNNSYGTGSNSYDTSPKLESVQGHATLKRMLKPKKDSMNVGTSAGPRPADLRAAMTQKTQINLPYEFGGGDMSHNQMMPLNMYMNEGENQDPLPYNYIFCPNTVPMTHHLQTSTSSSMPSSAINTGSKPNNTPHSSTHSIHRPASPMGMNPSMLHLPAADHSYHQGSLQADKNLLLLSPNSSLDAAASQLHMPTFGQKHPIPVYSQSSGVTAPTHPGHNVQQQNLGPASSTLTNLSQQIHMSLYQ